MEFIKPIIASSQAARQLSIELIDRLAMIVAAQESLNDHEEDEAEKQKTSIEIVKRPPTGNPARLIRRSKEPLGRVRFLSPEEEVALRAAIAATLPGRTDDEGESALARLDIALHTGMRKSEQFTATWDQVDLATRT